MIQGLQKENIVCVSEHSCDLSLIKKDSKVLDLGARNFGWSKAMLSYVDKIWCIDADKDVISYDQRLPVLHVAVSDIGNKTVQLIKFGNGTGNYIHEGTNPIPARAKEQTIKTATLSDIMYYCFEASFIDLIKLDIEKSEVKVILSLDKAPAKQISCEFHQHLGTTAQQVKECFEHLEKLGYELVFKDYSRKHGLAENVWDSLFLLRENFYYAIK